LRSSQPGTRAPSRSGFVITVLLSAAPGSSPFRRIPETIDSLPHPTGECKRFVKRAQNFRRRDIFTGEYAAKRGRYTSTARKLSRPLTPMQSKCSHSQRPFPNCLFIPG
ncbi:MAG: hypothetical protein ACLUMN_05780, partial [Oscillospiraceae bacterium]